jgi:aspartyl-tRNA(Asn)/glutamyl-tRNA(Gln) amidotransferase subunit C
MIEKEKEKNMTKISKKDVEHIAKLSALELTAEEIDKYSEQLSQVLEYVGELNQVDTKNIKPLFQVTDLKNVTRDDKVEPSEVTKEEFLNLAKNKDNDYYKTEKLFE